MSQVAKVERRLSVADYFEIEETSATKHEFFEGTLFAMGGATARHGLISINLILILGSRRPKGCELFANDMRLRIARDVKERYYYPDALVSCAQDDRAPLFREKPVLLAEISSPSTERIDRGEKYDWYIRIPTLLEYLLIQQDIPKVELFRRRSAWRGETFFLEDTMEIESLGVKFAVADLYRDVAF